MNDISQTKEGFIKSMILFIVLLGICFAPFFAFSNNVAAPITVDMRVDQKQVNCKIVTAFECRSYAIEARNNGEGEFMTIFSCNDAQCQDASQTLSYSFDLIEYPYTDYRIKVTDLNGNTYYQTGMFNKAAGTSAVELMSNAVNEVLMLKTNGLTQLDEFSYSLCDFNGVTLMENVGLNGNSIDLTGIGPGLYMISLRNNSGEEFHYKFLKQ